VTSAGQESAYATVLATSSGEITAFGADMARARPAPVTYRVIKISKGDYLNVRTGAGSNYPVVMKLQPGTGGIVLGAQRVANAETIWQEIIVNGRTGWVNADYIAPATNHLYRREHSQNDVLRMRRRS
jgi:uncharacterized protein YgiM (DUF1202 family)